MNLEGFTPVGKVLFLVGGPGSGKDFIINSALRESVLVEISLDKLYTAILNKEDLTEVNNLQSLVVNGNADRYDAVKASKAVLEAMGYETSMLYVYTSNEASKARNDARIARHAKTFTEEQRFAKYNKATGNLGFFSEEFDNLWLFDNSADAGMVNEETNGWLHELGTQMSTFFCETQTMKDYVKHMSGPTVPKPIQAPAQPHTSNLKGYERVKDGNRWVLRRKATTESTKYNTHLNLDFETYTDGQNEAMGMDYYYDKEKSAKQKAAKQKEDDEKAKAAADAQGDDDGGGKPPFGKGDDDSDEKDDSKKNPFAKGDDDADQKDDDDSDDKDDKKPNPFKKKVDEAIKAKQTKKNKGPKSANPPPDFFDGKMGMVPSGSLGITSSYAPTGKSLSEIKRGLVSSVVLEGIDEFTPKAERAQAMHDFIHKHAGEGKTVYLQTPLRTTAIKKKHLGMVRLRNGALEVQHGKKWLDHSHSHCTAQ